MPCQLGLMRRLGRTPNLQRQTAQLLVLAGLYAQVALLGGCSASAPSAELTRTSTPTQWTLVAPKGVRELPEVKALIAARATRFNVEVIEFDPAEGTAESRLASVRARLTRASAAAPTSAGATTDQLLLIGSPELLSMGPWHFEGVKQAISTDWLLTTNLEVSNATDPVSGWKEALSQPALRTVGRLPFDDTKMVSVAAQATLDHDRISQGNTGTAVLSASGTAYAWPMASARRKLQDSGWKASLYGDGGSCDALPRDFESAWQGTGATPAASLVVAAGPSYPDLNDAPSASTQPSSIFVAFTPNFAHPESLVISNLMAYRRTAAIAGFTADISASPLSPALESMVNVPRLLADGTPVGLVMESERRAYWARASGDFVAWMPIAREDRALLALSAVLYGDPALQACKTPAATRSLNDSPELTVVVTDTAFGESMTETPASMSGMSGRAIALTIALFAVLVALAAAWASRRKHA